MASPALLLAGFLLPGLAFGADAPVPDKGDTAWLLTSTVLVILMTIPGLALFYGGMVRSKNVLSVLMQVFMTFCLIALLWAIYGYSVAFTGGSAVLRRLRPALPERADRRVDGGHLLEGRLRAGDRLLRLPAHLCLHHALPHRRCLRRAHEVLGRAGVPRDLVHLRLPADRPHGLVLGRPGRLHGCGGRRRCGRHGGLPVPEGRPRLRRWHGGAHQRGHCRPGRRATSPASAWATAVRPSSPTTCRW